MSRRSAWFEGAAERAFRGTGKRTDGIASISSVALVAGGDVAHQIVLA